jgi:3-mercaptopyruvate sulfurtransferase SseA
MTKAIRAVHLAVAVAMVAASLASAAALPQEAARPQGAAPPFPVDPQTGRAIGAKEMAPDTLRELIEKKAPVIIIDVRDEAQFTQETIKGAVHVPFAELEARLKDIPKDTILAFT